MSEKWQRFKVRDDYDVYDGEYRVAAFTNKQSAYDCCTILNFVEDHGENYRTLWIEEFLRWQDEN